MQVTDKEIQPCKTSQRIRREILLEDFTNFTAVVGTMDSKECPETVYITITFWVDYKTKGELTPKETKKYLEECLNRDFKVVLNETIKNSQCFIELKDIVFIINVPESINTTEKRNFVSMEIFLHTTNIISEHKIPLDKKNDTFLFDNCINVIKHLSNTETLSGNGLFNINKKSK